MTHPSFATLCPGQCTELAPGLRRVLADNPSALTGPGTNTYIVGTGRVALIDPGPESPAHLAAVLAALAPGEVVEAIVVTHAHLDHSALAPRLAAAVRAPVLAYGTAQEGRNPALAALPDLGGGEGLDLSFRPDARLADGDTLTGPDWSLRVLHTPGHLGNHICLVWGDALFSGDMAMGWATSIVSPPDGDMTAYMASLATLSRQGARVLYPGHGPAVPDAAGRLAELAAHRRQREAQILRALDAGPATAEALARQIYTDVPATLLPAATRNVLAHLLDLQAGFRVHPHPSASLSALWRHAEKT